MLSRQLPENADGSRDAAPTLSLFCCLTVIDPARPIWQSDTQRYTRSRNKCSAR